MFVVFEGIDGSGKTTISNRVAKKLRKRGLSIEHVREDGEFASPLMNNIRLFGKDTRNLEMVPLAELLLYCTREAQLSHDAIRPALAKADLVFADRYLYSYEVLGCWGRELPEPQVTQVLDAVAGGLWPELVVLVDVDPHIARARRKVSKIDKRSGGGSRKGMGGVGTQHRLRAGYLDLARRDPDRWLVVDNTSAPLSEVVDQVTEAIAALVGGKPAGDVARSTARARERATTARGSDATLAGAPDAFYAAIEERAEREPMVAAYLLSGLEDERAWDWRDRLLAADPATASVIAYGLQGVGGERAWAMRRALVDVATYHVARSLDGLAVEGPLAEAMRAELVDREPAAVLATLDGNDSPAAWEIRHELLEKYPVEVLGSLKRIDTDEAWGIRQWHADAPLEPAPDLELVGALAGSLRGIASARAWGLRRACFPHAPVPTLGSLMDVFDEASWAWREQWAERAAKIVLRSFDGSDDPRAWALRSAHCERVKETIDSIVGMDVEAAWELRDRCADVWPSTVAKSVAPLAGSARARRLVDHLLAGHAANLSLLKHATRIAASAGVELKEATA